MHLGARKGLLILCFAVLSLPFLQLCLHVVKGLGLYGEFTNAADVEFSWDKWFRGEYQPAKASYLNDQGGFRADLVRANNQVDFWLYKKLHCNSVVLGKKGCLYQPDYINAYYGRDFIGYDSAAHIFGRLRAIQDTLGKLGKTLIVCYAPCKAFFYPGYFPDELVGPHVHPSNIETFGSLGDSLGVNQIDFNKWFEGMKDTSRELLYPLQGIHWSIYGADIAADSLTRYIERMRHISMQHMTWHAVEYSQIARETDDDVYKALNIICPLVKETLTYPVVEYKEDAARARPRTIYIGDSFCANWMMNNYMQFSGAGWEFWYYFHNAANQETRDNSDRWIPIDQDDWQGKMLKSDCIVILYTSHNLRELGNGFIEKAYKYFYPATKSVNGKQS